MYHATQEICGEDGMPAYEVSNHARPGAESRHNLIYWRYGDYVGIGPGAHGRLTLNGARFATESTRAPGAWLKAVSEESGDCVNSRLKPDEYSAEHLMMGMRLIEGIDAERYAQLAGHPLPHNKVQDLLQMGMVTQTGSILRATDQGRAVLNAVLRELLAD